MYNYKHDMVGLERDLEGALEAISDLDLPYDIDAVFNGAINAIISDDYANHYTFNIESAIFCADATLVQLPAIFHLTIVVAPATANYLPPVVSNAYRCVSPAYVCAVTSDYFGDVPMPLAAQGSTVNHAVFAAILRYLIASLQKGGLRDAH